MVYPSSILYILCFISRVLYFVYFCLFCLTVKVCDCHTFNKKATYLLTYLLLTNYTDGQTDGRHACSISAM